MTACVTFYLFIAFIAFIVKFFNAMENSKYRINNNTLLEAIGARTELIKKSISHLVNLALLISAKIGHKCNVGFMLYNHM